MIGMASFKYRIVLTLVLFELSSNHGHSIRNPKKDPFKTHSDVYEIRNQGDSITFVNPKLEENKLREIVYYHVVEKPCSHEGKADTERPFTNAHGYPFLEEFVHKNPDDTITEEPTTEFDVQNMLIDQDLPEPSDKLQRKKRDVADQNVPEAPAIPAIRYENFPAYLRDMISTETPQSHDLKLGYGEEARNRNAETPELQTNINLDDINHRIQDRMGGVSSRMIPRHDGLRARTYGMRLKSGQGYVWNDGLGQNDGIKTINENDAEPKLRIDVRGPKNDIQLESTGNNNIIRNKIAKAREILTEQLLKELERTEERQENLNKGENNDEDEKANTMVEPNKEFFRGFHEMPGTYGMRLFNGHGYVWNDIFADPGLSFETGNGDNQSEIDIRDPLSEISTDAPVEESNNEDLETNADDNKENNHNDESITDLDDIFVQVAKYKQTTPAPVSNEDLTFRRRKDKDDTHRVIDELLKSDEFWGIIVEWSEMYMDIMTKYIKKTVKSEVKKELAAHFEAESQTDEHDIKEDDEYLEKTSLEPHKDQDLHKTHELIFKKDKFIIDGVEIPLSHTSDYSVYKELDNGEKKLLRTRKVIKKRPSGNKNEENKKEIPDLDTKPTTENGKNHTDLFNIENIYGNNVGNQKVTNVFVFYPNEGLDKVLEELKPIAGEDGVIIIKPDKDKKDEDKKEESVNTDTEKPEILEESDKKEEMSGSEKENPELVEATTTDQINPNPEVNKPEEEPTKPETEENIENEDSKTKPDNVELDERRF